MDPFTNPAIGRKCPCCEGLVCHYHKSIHSNESKRCDIVGHGECLDCDVKFDPDSPLIQCEFCLKNVHRLISFDFKEYPCCSKPARVCCKCFTGAFCSNEMKISLLNLMILKDIVKICEDYAPTIPLKIYKYECRNCKTKLCKSHAIKTKGGMRIWCKDCLKTFVNSKKTRLYHKLD